MDIRTAYSDEAVARSLEVVPRCMVERLRLNSEEGARREAFLVTAVGFSPDYRKESGKPDSGGEVWLQSTVSR